MTPEEETPESPPRERPDTPLFPPASGRSRWLFFVALAVAAALAFWRCG
jgi:hypothetical protein